MEKFEVPAACTLPTADRPLRVAEFGAFFASAGAVSRPAPGWLRVRFPVSDDAAVQDLVARESACCSFFTFAIADGCLDVRVPPGQVAVLDGLERLARAYR